MILIYHDDSGRSRYNDSVVTHTERVGTKDMAGLKEVHHDNKDTEKDRQNR